MSGECSGSKPGRKRKDERRACCPWVVGVSGLANDGARQVSTADMDTVRFFCLPRHTRMDAFAVGLFGWVFSGWRSSVVEHSLGKGEVESSSLSVSSRF